MFEKLAKKEGLSLSRLQNGLKSGSIVAVRNAKRDVEPIAIGAGTRVKINANIGTSPDVSDIKQEIEKAHIAVEAGADTLMDLSIGGDIDAVRKKILKETNVPLGTVPIYQAFLEKRLEMDSESILKVIERQCKDGVDFLTIHSGITKDVVGGLKSRLIPITSRGGSFLAAWMIKNEQENPLYSHFDDILEIAKEYEVVLSLGDALRPACIHDASDNAQIQELLNLGKLTKKAREAGVQIIIEGPGHMPIDQIEMNVKLEKKICDNAPFYVLGPLVTDIGMGRDHITGAIGGAVAAMHGADFLCYVTPSEHLGLPTKEDVREGVIASKIAAHAADIVRLRDTSRDDELSKARKNLDWNRMFDLCLDKKLGAKHGNLKNKKECTMCGQYCALKILKEWIEK